MTTLPPIKLPGAPGRYDPENEAALRRSIEAALTQLNQLAAAQSASGVTPGTYGDSTDIPVLVINADGVITSASTVAAAGGGAVSSVFGRTAAVTAQTGDYSVAQVTGAAPIDSPTFTTTAAAPTPATGDNSTKIATTAFVNKEWPYAGAIPTPTVFSAGSSYTVQPADAFILITTASTYPTVVLPAASSPRYLKLCWAVGTWGQANSSQALLTPNGTDTICGISGSGQQVMARGYDTCDVWTTGNGNWTVTFPGYALVNFAAGQQFPGSVSFLGTVTFSSSGNYAQFQSQPKSWGGAGVRATLEPLSRSWQYTPSGAGDTTGVGSDLTYDSNYLYLNTGTELTTGGAWARIPLQSFTAPVAEDCGTYGAY